MAVFEYSRSVSEGASIFNRVSSFAYHLASRVIAWNDARMTRRALSRLSDRQLEDIGLTRGDVNRLY